MNRRHFLTASAGALGVAVAPRIPAASASGQSAENAEPAQWPMPDLTERIREPVKIRAVELLRTQKQLLLRVTAEDGSQGVTQCNVHMRNLTSLLEGIIIKHFVGQDARNVRTLVDNAYRSDRNYKYAGMPMWNCITPLQPRPPGLHQPAPEKAIS